MVARVVERGWVWYNGRSRKMVAAERWWHKQWVEGLGIGKVRRKPIGGREDGTTPPLKILHQVCLTKIAVGKWR